MTYYLDSKTGNLTTDEDLAIAMTGWPGVTAQVDVAIAILVADGTLEPMWLPEAA